MSLYSSRSHRLLPCTVHWQQVCPAAPFRMKTILQVKRSLLASLILLLLLGCREERFEVPALAEDGEPAIVESRAVAAFDLLTPDLEESMQFYGALFAWTFEPLPFGSGYVARWNDKNVAVFFRNVFPGLGDGGNQALWLPSITVDDLSSVGQMVQASGGSILRKKFDLPNRGATGIYRDLAGAPFALLQPNGGVQPSEERFWSQSDILAMDQESLTTFYQEALGMDSLFTRSIPPTILLRYEGETKARLLKSRFSNVSAVWVPITKVRSVREIMMLADHFGGRVLFPEEIPNEPVQRAVFQDPQGALFAVEKE